MLAAARRRLPLRTPYSARSWDGDGGIRIPDEALQEMSVDVGDSLYLIRGYVGNTRCLVLSKTPRISDRVDELVGHWDSFGKLAKDLNAKDE